MNSAKKLLLLGGSIFDGILLDIDCGPDCEDTAAIGLLNIFANLGETNHLADVVCITNQYSPGCVDAINTYYGNGSIPIGNNKGAEFLPGPGDYAQYISENFSNDVSAASAEDSTAMYRRILKMAKPKGIKIVLIGPCTTLARFMAETDATSLITAKVSEIIIMGGVFPTGTEWNFQQDPASAEYVAVNSPVPVVYCGFEVGELVVALNTITELASVSNPISKAYELDLGLLTGRSAWDQLTVLYAVRGLVYAGTTYYTKVRGIITINSSTGENTWEDDASGNHYYLVKAQTNAWYVSLLYNLIIVSQMKLNSIVSDTFTGDGSLDVHVPDLSASGGWTENVGDWSISGNKLTVAASETGKNFATIDAAHADVTVLADITMPASTKNIGLVANYTDINNCWLLNIWGTAISLYEVVAGTETSRKVLTKTFTVGQTYQIALKTSGDAIYFWVDDGLVQAYSVADRSGKTETLHGIRIYKIAPGDEGTDTGSTVDNFSIVPG